MRQHAMTLRPRHTPSPAYCLSCLLLLWLLTTLSGMARAADLPESETTPQVVVVLNPPPHRDSLQTNEVRAIFSMNARRWDDGSPIRVFVMPDRDTTHQRFVQQVLALLPHQLRRHWDRLVYTGTGQAPNEVADAAAMLKQLRRHPGSIGYLELTPKLSKLLQEKSNESLIIVDITP